MSTSTPAAAQSAATTTVAGPARSAGHICFSGNFEFIEIRGQVFRAPLDAVMDIQLGARIGRWECTRAQFEHFRSVILNVSEAHS